MDEVDFLLVTALEEERDALLSKLPGHQKLDKDGLDVHTYYQALAPTERADGAKYNIIVTCLVQMGPLQAAAQTACAVSRWRPQAVLMVGIAGGIGDEVKLGDVLVADQVVDYSLGKIESVDGQPRRKVRWEAHRSDRSLYDSAKNLHTGWDSLISVDRPGDGSPRRHLGVIASGGDVVADEEFVKEYKSSWAKLLGVEMEGGGVATALHASFERPRFLMVRGVSDRADPDKNAPNTRVWREYACHVAAAYAVALLRAGPLLPRPPVAPPSVTTASAAGAINPSMLRARDVRTLRELLSTLDVGSVDYFLDRASSFALPDSIFYFLEGFRSVYHGSSFYIHDTTMRKLVTEFSSSFIECFNFGEYFDPVGNGSEYRFMGSPHTAISAEWSDAKNRFMATVTATRKAFRALVKGIQEYWPEIDINELSTAAQAERAEFDARMDRTFADLNEETIGPSTNDESPLRQAMALLLRQAEAEAANSGSASEEVEISLKLETTQEEAAARQLETEGQGKLRDGTYNVSVRRLM